MTGSDRFAIVLTRMPADPLQLSGILAGTLKIPRFEASKKVQTAPGIPARELTQTDARQLESALRLHGIDSMVIGEDEIPRLPAATQIRGAKLDDEGLCLYEDPDCSTGKAWKLPWDLHLLLCCGRVKITVEERKREAGRRSLSRYGGLSGVAFRIDDRPVRETKITKKTSAKIFFDMIPLHTSHHFRIIGEEFNYLAIGLDQPTVFESLTALIRNISLRCINPCRDGSIDNILDGDPLTNTSFPCPEAYENHVLRGVLLGLHDRKSP